MSGDGILLLGASAAVGGAVVLRLSWARRARSHPLNLAGWGLLALAAALGWQAAGAWGLSVEVIVAMVVALSFLAYAAWTSPPGATKASNRRAGMLPEQGKPLRLGRRLVTFVLVGILALLASLGAALGMRLLAILAGAGEADANVLALFIAPLAWSLLGYALLMTLDRRRQFGMVAVGSLLAVPAFFQGVYS